MTFACIVMKNIAGAGWTMIGHSDCTRRGGYLYMKSLYRLCDQISLDQQAISHVLSIAWNEIEKEKTLYFVVNLIARITIVSNSIYVFHYESTFVTRNIFHKLTIINYTIFIIYISFRLLRLNSSVAKYPPFSTVASRF